ncbi:uncharacterized protein CTRU02_201877 [Colletotrichum truncatum]|uniref:Uncharacterized protein n=1 Tax=Colletotrichum truncatum TaxID=5467 RepID=A0ACC3ZIN3_COLTU
MELKLKGLVVPGRVVLYRVRELTTRTALPPVTPTEDMGDETRAERWEGDPLNPTSSFQTSPLVLTSSAPAHFVDLAEAMNRIRGLQ